MLLELKPLRKVVAALAAEFQITPRAARSDVERVRSRMRAEAATETPLAQRLAWYVAALEAVRAHAFEAEDFGAALRATVQLARVIGAEPRVQRHHVTADASVTIDGAREYARHFCRLLLQKMPDREKEIGELLELLRRTEDAAELRGAA